MLTEEIRTTVNRAIEQLPEDLRTAIILREVEGLSYEEIAEAMDCPVGTVRSRIFRAREAIDRSLKPLLTEYECNMTDQIREQMSALLDGELPQDEVGLLVRRMERDIELQRAFGSYVLIGETLRAPGAATASPGFAARVQREIEAEPRASTPARTGGPRPAALTLGTSTRSHGRRGERRPCAAVFLLRPGERQVVPASAGVDVARPVLAEFAGSTTRARPRHRASVSPVTSSRTASSPRRSAAAASGPSVLAAGPGIYPRRLRDRRGALMQLARPALALSVSWRLASAPAHAAPDDDAQRVARAHDRGAGDARTTTGCSRIRTACQTESMRIVHRVEGGHSVERLVSLDGSGREIVRTPREVHAYLPDRRVVLVEPRTDEGSLLKALPAPGAQLDAQYVLEMHSGNRLLGRDVRVLEIRPRDAYRYGYRLWLDEKTAMPLRSEVCDQAGRPVERIQFTRLDMHSKMSGARDRAVSGRIGFPLGASGPPDCGPPRRRCWLAPVARSAGIPADRHPGADAARPPHASAAPGLLRRLRLRVGLHRAWLA